MGQGFYLVSDTGTQQLIRMQGGVNGSFLVPAHGSGQLTPIGPVWDAGQTVDVQLLTEQCDVIDHVTLPASSTIVIVKLHGRSTNPLTSTRHLPSAPIPEQPLLAATTCTG